MQKNVQLVPSLPELCQNKVSNEAFMAIAAKARTATTSSEKHVREQRLVESIQAFVRLSKSWGAEGGLPATTAATENLHDTMKVCLIDFEDELGQDAQSQCDNVRSCVRAALESALAQSAEPSESANEASSGLCALLLSICKYLKEPAQKILQQHFRLAELVILVRDRANRAASQGMSEAEFMKLGTELMSCAKLCENPDADNEVCHANLQEVRDEAERVLEHVRLTLAESMKTTIHAAAQKIKDVAGGKPGGASWKQSISDPAATYQWTEIVKAAQPLLAGDSGGLVQGFKALKQDAGRDREQSCVRVVGPDNVVAREGEAPSSLDEMLKSCISCLTTVLAASCWALLVTASL